MHKRHSGWMIAALAAIAALWISASAGDGTQRNSVRAHTAQACSGDSTSRDPRNPLGLAKPPGSDPLRGASFFVDGPRHGSAAGAIASLLGQDPTGYSDDYSWLRFKSQLDHGRPHARLQRDHRLAYKVNMLAKVASEPAAQRFSAYSGGGGPGAVLGQVNKIFCSNLTADRGTIPIISTYFAHPAVGYCSGPGPIQAAMPTFRRRIDEMAAGTGNHPAVYLLELDALGSSGCFASSGALPAWEAMLRYEVDKMGALPHTLVYLEAGYSDSNGSAYTARALNAVGIGHIRGFFTNDTHINWTINEVRWAQRISALTHGAHYIVNSAQNGNGPLLNRNRVKNGNEDLCNPPGRGLGPRHTTSTAFRQADAFLWTHVPGNSSGSCHGGPASGSFWAARAIGLAGRANNRVGPRYRSQPY
jgi:hypothetical protein